jgi:predicted adenylyl cyclase CyaB
MLSCQKAWAACRRSFQASQAGKKGSHNGAQHGDKSWARDFQKQMAIAGRLGDGQVQHLFQEDTFFCVPAGRLKLRDFGDGSGELIQYERGDSFEPTESRYLRLPTGDPAALKEALTNALGVRAVVRKKRSVHLVGQCRIHLDQVEDLGTFVELEVVLQQGEHLDYGAAIAKDLMAKLEVGKQDLIESSYVDLLENRVPNKPIQTYGASHHS